MGAIMSIGVATANSILMITFANDQRKLRHERARRGAGAGLTRLRPVIMTALAMIIGMLPMSLGWAKAASRTRRWARGDRRLVAGHFHDAFLRPVVYSALRRTAPQTQVEPEFAVNGQARRRRHTAIARDERRDGPHAPNAPAARPGDGHTTIPTDLPRVRTWA
jgi:hypothetical protein